MKLQELTFSARTHNALKAHGLITVADLANADMAVIPNLGSRSLAEVARTLAGLLAAQGCLDVVWKDELEALRADAGKYRAIQPALKAILRDLKVA